MPSKTAAEDIEIDEVPTTINPYTELCVSETATTDQIKTAYRKAALKHHPDKASPDTKDAANAKFQQIAFAYAILSDPRRRSRYDATGRTEESLELDDDDSFDWVAYYREQYANVITGDAIAKFSEEYKGSDEEREALLGAYERFEGDMDRVYQTVMTSDPAVDDERFRGIINEAIEKGEVEAYERFTEESTKSIKARISWAKKAGKEAEAHARKLGVHDKLFGGGAKGKGKGKGKGGDSADGNLASLIQQRNKGRAENFLADLEAKYAAPKEKKGKGKKRAEPMDEPPEEAFERNAKKSKTKKGKAWA